MPPEKASPRRCGRPTPYGTGRQNKAAENPKSHEEIAELEKFFLIKRCPDDFEMEDIVKTTNLPFGFVVKWFSKRRGEEAGLKLCSLDSMRRGKKSNRLLVTLVVDDFGDERVMQEADQEATMLRERLVAKQKYREVRIRLFTSPLVHESDDQASVLLASHIDSMNLGTDIEGKTDAENTQMKEMVEIDEMEGLLE